MNNNSYAGFSNSELLTRLNRLHVQRDKLNDQKTDLQQQQKILEINQEMEEIEAVMNNRMTRKYSRVLNQ